MTCGKPADDFVTIKENGKVDKLMSASLFRGKTTKELKKLLDLKGSDCTIFIRTHSTIYYCGSDLILVDYFPMLIHSKDQKDIKYSLQILKKEYKKCYIFIFKLITKNQIKMPEFYVNLDVEKFHEKSGKYLIDEIKNRFDPNCTWFKIFINTKPILEREPAIQIIGKMIDQDLVITCNLSVKTISQIIMREERMKEIATSEGTYISRLLILQNYIQYQMNEKKVLKKKERDFIFSFFKPIIKEHAIFLNAISKTDCTYCSNILYVFLEHFESFMVAKDIFHNQEKINQILAKLKGNKEMENIISNNFGEFRNLTIDSLFIEPIQRYTRYIILIEAMMEKTPKSHPDWLHYDGLKDLMDLVNRKMQNMDLIEQRMKVLAEISYKINDTIIDDQRTLILKERVHSLERDEKMEIYVLNDLLIVTQKLSKKKEKVILKINMVNAAINESKISLRDITIYDKSQMENLSRVVFRTEKKKKQFLDAI